MAEKNIANPVTLAMEKHGKNSHRLIMNRFSFKFAFVSKNFHAKLCAIEDALWRKNATSFQRNAHESGRRFDKFILMVRRRLVSFGD